MRRPVSALLASVVVLVAPALADGAKAKPKAKARAKPKVQAVSKLPTQTQLAAQQTQRVAQAMLLLEQQQAEQALDLGGGVYQGAAIPSRYGPIQVTITVAGGKIVEVKGTWDIDIPRSIQIDTAAFPLLHDNVLAVQGTKLDMLTGATLTIDAYQASLQSALVRAHMSTVGAIPLGPY